MKEHNTSFFDPLIAEQGDTHLVAENANVFDIRLQTDKQTDALKCMCQEGNDNRLSFYDILGSVEINGIVHSLADVVSIYPGVIAGEG